MKAFLFSVVLVGCTNATDEFLERTQCLKGHNESFVQMMLIGRSVMPITQVRFVCERERVEFFENPDFKGVRVMSKPRPYERTP